MPQYRSPGVYVEEIDAGPKPIEGVSTSICGAVGVTARGPTSGKPTLCTSFMEFTRTFGGYLPVPEDAAILTQWADLADGGNWWQFPLSVKAFFDNGGEQIYVKRVFSKDALASSAIAGQGLIAQLKSDADWGANEITPLHLIGFSKDNKVQIFNADTGQIPGDFTIDKIDYGSGSITIKPKLPDKPDPTVTVPALSAKRNDFIQIKKASALPVPAAEQTLGFNAKGLGKWGDDVRVRVRPMVGATYNILFDPTVAPNPAAATDVVAVKVVPGPPIVSEVEVKTTNGFTAADHITIGNKEYVIDSINPADAVHPNPYFKIKDFDLHTVPAGTKVTQLRKANDPATAAQTMNVWAASAIYDNAIIELSDGQYTETFTVSGKVGNTLTLNKKPTKQYYEGYKLRVIEAEVTVQYRPKGGDLVEETFTNLRLTKDSPSYLVTNVTNGSQFVEVGAINLSGGDDLAKFPTAPVNGQWLNLTGGDDALKSLKSDNFVGVDGGSGNRTGIQALEDNTDISIVIVPGMWSRVIQSALITHCETLKSRFAIVDPWPKVGVAEIQEFRNGLPDTKYAALYYPWVTVRDPSVSQDVDMAPSGHMAGLYARVDNERGVHKAPANEVIRNIQKLAADVTKREQDLLNPVNINAFRYFPGRGNRAWGARVVTSDAAWKYINVRRLFIYVEQSIDRGTQWVVFEPNDEPLWARVRQTITNFLTTVWRSGALQGAKAEEAFFVKCDRSTMTQDDIDNGRLICLIGIAPVKPAEFVIFRIQQKTLDQKTA
jgi:phage tail sheath protein FI